jgi:hypothetical protein
VVFRRNFADSERADGASGEMRDVMKDFESPPAQEPIPESVET